MLINLIFNKMFRLFNIGCKATNTFLKKYFIKQKNSNIAAGVYYVKMFFINYNLQSLRRYNLRILQYKHLEIEWLLLLH